MALWHLGGSVLGAYIGLPLAPPHAVLPANASVFGSPPFLWLYIYYAAATAAFALFWQLVSPHRWWAWSILGTSAILFLTYLSVETLVATTRWDGVFYDMLQVALTRPGVVSIKQLVDGMMDYAYIVVVYVVVNVASAFLVSHFIFRWRNAMNDYYVANWDKLRLIEGAAQRIQEDTMRFSTTMETLGVSFVQAVLTLIAFLPALAALSVHVPTLPFVGAVPLPLVVAAVSWSLFGTLCLIALGVKLPGIQFAIQRVEASYRKELVYGEDDPGRAQRPTLDELFEAVRQRYYSSYFHYTYFNAGRFAFQQADTVFALFALMPTIAAGAITFGVLMQIMSVFQVVRASFQYLITSAPIIVELMSIYKRLRAFEATLSNEPLPAIEMKDPATAGR